METFDLKEYRKTANAQIKVFIDYIYDKFSFVTIDNGLLPMINENHLIESLEYYISLRATAQITASNYMTSIKNFFELLSGQYNIKSELFNNKERLSYLDDKAKEVISRLRETVPKGIADDPQYEILVTAIERYINDYKEEDICNEILRIGDGTLKNVRLYHRFISIITTKLGLIYALQGLPLVIMSKGSVDLVQNVIIVNNISLPLVDKDLLYMFNSYLKMRSLIYDINGKNDEGYLFVKPNGEPYVQSKPNRTYQPEYGSFYKIVKDSIGNVAIEPFSYRRIIELYEKGVDLLTLSNISGTSYQTCFDLVKKSNEEMSRTLLRVFSNDQINRKKTTSEISLICPSCREQIGPESSNWVLVQKENEDKKRLACSKCKGRFYENIL